jgi:hypothetical protein
LPTWAYAALNVTSIEKRWRGRRMPADAERRRHRGEVGKSEEGYATLDLLLKHPNATLATYI